MKETVVNSTGLRPGALVAGGVGGLGALISVFAAMMAPVQGDVNTLREKVTEVDRQIRAHEDIENHPGGVARMAELSQRFAEVETQFRNLNERTERIDRDIDRAVAALREQLTTKADGITLLRDAQNLRYDEAVSKLEAGLSRLEGLRTEIAVIQQQLKPK